VEDWYRLIFEHGAWGVLLLDQEGRVLDVNPAACRLLRRDRGAIFQGEWDDFFQLPSRQALVAHLAASPRDVLTLEGFLKGGGPGPDLLLDASVVPWGDTRVLIAGLRPLTLSAASEHERRGLRDAVNSLQDGSTTALFVMDREGRARPFPETAPGREEGPDSLLWVGDLLSAPRLADWLAQAWAGRRAAVPPAWHLPPEGGAERWLRMELTPLRGPSEEVGAVLVRVEDATSERLDMEEARRQERAESLSLYAGLLTGELATHLGVILAQASALRLDAGAGRVAAPPVGAILDASQAAVALLRRAAEIGRSRETGLESFDGNQCAAEAARILRQLWRDRVRLSCGLAEGLPALRGEPALLQAALVALGLQVEAGVPAGSELRLRTYPVAPETAGEPARVGFSFSESGLRLEPPASAESARLAEGGEGPEAAFVRAVALRFRGQLQRENQAGFGAAWRLILPARGRGESGSDSAARKPQTPLLAEAPGGRRLVLVADDEENFRDFVRETLRREGFEVAAACDGQDAMERFQKEAERYGLVILDAYMPRLGGLETYLRMQVLRPDLPVLFVSGFAGQATRQALLGAFPGHAQFLQKPIGEPALFAAMQQAFRQIRGRS
jgi:CheY-like chemotaxis protein